MIISVSRRCDIPRFQFDWFMERLNEGYVDVRNPFNAAQIKRVSLLPGEAGPLVFWTRDPRPILANVQELETRGFPFYVMVTVTGYPAMLEPNAVPMETVCAAMGELAKKTEARRVIWRYDPIFLSSITDENFHRRNFSTLAMMLSGSVHRVIISVYDEYRGAKCRIETLKKTGVIAISPDSDIGPLLAELAQTAHTAGMEIQGCAEDLEAFGIRRGACIDGELIRELWGIEAGGRDKNQRPQCLCAQSIDIGSYGDCPAGCVYCYARPNR